MKPDVSVVVPAYRTEAFIGECVESILSQTYKNLEAVVVYERDDETTARILESYEDPRIVHVKQEKNTGVSNARNMGIDASSGDFIALCDGDDFFYPEKIERQMETLSSGDYGLTYTDLAIVDENSDVISSTEVPEWDFKLWLRRTYIGASTLLFRRDLAEQVGLFREDLHANEDLDFLIKMARITDFRKTPGVLTARRIHSSNMSRRVFKNVGTRFRVYHENGYTLLGLYAAAKNIIFTPVILWSMNKPGLYHRLRRMRR